MNELSLGQANGCKGPTTQSDEWNSNRNQGIDLLTVIRVHFIFTYMHYKLRFLHIIYWFWNWLRNFLDVLDLLDVLLRLFLSLSKHTRNYYKMNFITG